MPVTAFLLPKPSALARGYHGSLNKHMLTAVIHVSGALDPIRGTKRIDTTIGSQTWTMRHDNNALNNSFRR